MKRRERRSNFFEANRIDCLVGRIHGSKKAIPVKVLPRQKFRKNVCFSSASCSTPREGLCRPCQSIQPIHLSSDLHQVMKPNKVDTSESCIKHYYFAIADQQYSRVDTTFNVHCRVHYKEYVNVPFVHHNAKSVRYRTVLRA